MAPTSHPASMAIESFTPKPPTCTRGILTPKVSQKTHDQAEIAPHPQRKIRYHLAPRAIKPEHPPIPIPGSDKYPWISAAVAEVERTGRYHPERVHNIRDDITDYSEKGSQFWGEARDCRVALARHVLENNLNPCHPPYQYAKKYLPKHHGLVQRKDVKIVPDHLPAEDNIREQNCELWHDLSFQMGERNANSVWESKVIKPKIDYDDDWWPMGRDLMMIQAMREQRERKEEALRDEKRFWTRIVDNVDQDEEDLVSNLDPDGFVMVQQQGKENEKKGAHKGLGDSGYGTAQQQSHILGK